MPSAASAKTEKQNASNIAEIPEQNNSATPIRQAIIIIEHKIRNLEKRKTRLETYREIQASGKELSSDQKAAVAKYDEVTQSLEFARDLSKQMVNLATVSEKEQKKQARKEALLKAQTETLKIREVLTIQNILVNFEDCQVRNDFLNGTNGAVQLENSDIDLLERFYIDIAVKRQTTPEDVPFLTCAQKAAECLSMTIDGRPKQYLDTTYERLRNVLQTIQDCGYFDQAGKLETPEGCQIEIDSQDNDSVQILVDEYESTGTTKNENNNDDTSNVSNENQTSQSQSTLKLTTSQFSSEAPSAALVPTPAFPQAPPNKLINQHIPTQQQIHRTSVLPTAVVTIAAVQANQVPAAIAVANTPALHTTHFPGTTVRAVEQAYFKQHQYIQQMRPLAEVIGSANFYFLQESELDSPDIVSNTFTNNEPSTGTNNINACNVPAQNTAANILSQQSTLQQNQAAMQTSQASGILQGKPQPQPTAAPIPTQTFTNQSFPPIVPPQAFFQASVPPNSDIKNSTPNPIPVFTAQPIPIPTVVAKPNVVPQGQITTISKSENQQTSGVAVVANPQQQSQNLLAGPNVINKKLPAFTNASFAVQNPSLVTHQNNVNIPKNTFDTSKNPAQSHTDNHVHKPVDEVKSEIIENSAEWKVNDAPAKSLGSNNENESNQWSNESMKNEWNNNFDNQNESSTWNNNQTEPYGNRNNRNNYNNSRGGNVSNNRNLRGNNHSTSGYRGRTNNSYQQQQNGRNTGSYFRNNSDNGYFQNQNDAFNSNKQETNNSGSNYGGNSYRGVRGGPSTHSRQQSGGRIGHQNNLIIPRNNNNSNRPTNIGLSNSNNRTSRNNSSGTTGNYGNPRPSTNAVRHQDVNA